MGSRHWVLIAGALLVVVALLVGQWLAKGSGAPRQQSAEATVAAADETIEPTALETLEPGSVEATRSCGPPSVCSAPTALAVAAGMIDPRHSVDERVALLTRMSVAETTFGFYKNGGDEPVWIVAFRYAPITPDPESEAGYPQLFDFGDNGIVVLIGASGGGTMMQMGLSLPGEPGVLFDDVVAIRDEPDLKIDPPTPVPSTTPTERCGPFVLCTPAGVMAVAHSLAEDLVVDDRDATEGEMPALDLDQAQARLVRWGTVSDELAQMEGWVAGGSGCGDALPDQLVWVVAMPFSDGPVGQEVSGIAALYSPADNYGMFADARLVVEPDKGLTMEEVARWESEPIPEHEHDAVPGCSME